MKTLLALLLLIPSLCFSNNINYKDWIIKKPNLLFIDKDQLIEKINNNAKTIFDNYSNKFIEESGKTQWGCRYSKYDVQDVTKLSLNQINKNNYFNYIELIGAFPIHYWCETVLRTSKSVSNSKSIYRADEWKKDREEKLKSFYNDLVKNEWLLNLPKPPNDDQIAYEIGVYLTSVLFTYTLIEEDLPKELQKNFKSQIDKLIRKYDYAQNESRVGELSVNSNHGFYYFNFKMAASIILNDNKMFQDSIKHFLKAMKANSTETGLFKLDSQRGECALHYNYHGLQPVMSMLWNLKLQGYDLFQVKLTDNHTIGQIIESVYEASMDTNLFFDHQKKYEKEFERKYGNQKTEERRKNLYQSCWVNDIDDEQAKRRIDTNGMMRTQSDSGWISIYEATFGKQKAERFQNIEAGWWWNTEKYATTNAYSMKDVSQIDSNLSIGGISYIIYQDNFPTIDYETIVFQEVTFDDLEF